jgi:hypothetical protein
MTNLTTIKCVGREMTGGNGHEHIAAISWEQVKDDEVIQRGKSSREDMVKYIEKNGNESVWCPDRNPKLKGAWVHVHTNGHVKYIQTVADSRKTDNLLSLPLI